MSQEGMPRRRQCATMQVHSRLLEQDPGFRGRMIAFEHGFARRALGVRDLKRRKLVTIPVVVHVVYRTTSENISASQVKSQIAVLNRDFRARNPDRKRVPDVWKGLVGDARVQFALAKRDPKGRPTSGITRTRTTRSGFGTGDTVKFAKSGGSAAWSASRYLNVWVCTLQGGLLGYAQFPGGPAKTDGVVILNRAFGTSGTARAPFDHGRTATHEVGHWLNLRHIWGDTEDCSGGDAVSDTPNAETPNQGKPTFPRISCGNGPHGDMFMNYMDYVDDAAMFMFTLGQISRMQAALDGPRKALARAARQRGGRR
ncbi:MAG: zinc metalloprotease [Candidatus Rokuibacteriota bacterium]